ncbi:MAG TPA: hypothetical protein VFI39_10190 [Gemmatimonadales bacterium]|nr:hypothetical protein [Gemmatimonadales bacterium]
MRAERLTSAALGRTASADLVGAVLLSSVQLPSGPLEKGVRLDPAQADALKAAVDTLSGPVSIAWLDADELHEDEAAWRLARAVGGQGVIVGVPHQSRVDLSAERAGVLHVNVEPLSRLNRIDPIEVCTLYHGSPVKAGEVVASVKVAPHVVPSSVIKKGEAFATGNTRLVRVAPYLPLDVGAIVVEEVSVPALVHFEATIRKKITALGARLDGVATVAARSPADAEAKSRSTLEYLVLQRRLPVVLVAGVSASDVLSPFFAALEALGGQLLRRGVPARPGSMLWLAELSGTRILGAPHCRTFDVRTAADLILPRLLTGEAITAETLAEIGHGGLLRG